MIGYHDTQNKKHRNLYYDLISALLYNCEILHSRFDNMQLNEIMLDNLRIICIEKILNALCSCSCLQHADSHPIIVCLSIILLFFCLSIILLFNLVRDFQKHVSFIWE